MRKSRSNIIVGSLVFRSKIAQAGIRWSFFDAWIMPVIMSNGNIFKEQDVRLVARTGQYKISMAIRKWL